MHLLNIQQHEKSLLSLLFHCKAGLVFLKKLSEQVAMTLASNYNWIVQFLN